MKIRSYKPKDYFQVKKLWKKLNMFDKSYDTKKKLDSKKPEGCIIVAEEKGKIVGTIIYTWDGWDSSIYRFSVDLEFQGKGIGNNLLLEAEKRLKKHGADISSICIETNNKKAEKFYLGKGYKICKGNYLYMEKKL